MTTIERKAAAKSERPPTSILHPNFVYVKSSDTDIAKTFERIRAQQVQSPNVVKIKRKVK